MASSDFITPPRQGLPSYDSTTRLFGSGSTDSQDKYLTTCSRTIVDSPDNFESPIPRSRTRYRQRPNSNRSHTTISFVDSRICLRYILAILLIGIVLTFSLSSLLHQRTPNTLNLSHLKHEDLKSQDILKPLSMSSSHNRKNKADPERWLREHIDAGDESFKQASHRRPRAALISLVRNEELEGILQSMRQLEYHWNRRYNYPWIFFSEKPFSEEFKKATSSATSSQTIYAQIPKPHWSTPPWIKQPQYHNSLTYLSTITVGKAHMPSYRHMCRWNSGFFYHHPILSSYDYYWRVEPDVHFFCDIHYDVFAFMADNDLLYGFNMNILDDARSFASLWSRTLSFVEEYPHLVHPDAGLGWLVDGDNGNEYNNCQFFSNFEIASLNFFRGEANEAYFQYLDESGGFFYERFGDAPIHTLSVALFAPKDRVWYFRDVGYQHDIARHCPRDGGVERGRCDCEETGLDENFYKLVPMESPQRKPGDSCVRLWLGGGWLDKKEGWRQDVERAFGGDGYGGYVREG